MRRRVENKITNAISKLNGTTSNLTLDTDFFNELQTRSFLEQLSNKLQEQDRELEQLTLSACTLDVLRGVNAFLQQKKDGTKVDELILETHPPRNKEEEQDFRLVFRQILIALSANQQTAFSIDDNLLQLFTEEEWLQFVNDNKIMVKINLPKELENTRLQRELDEVTYDNAYTHRIQNGKRQHDQQAKYQQRPKRQRLKQTGNFSLDIDVDMEKQQQKQLEVEAEKTTKELPTNHSPLQFGLTLAEFKALAQASAENILSEFEVEQLWHRCLGNVAVIETADGRFDVNSLPEAFQEQGTINISPNPALTGITKRASKQLLKHANQFKLGIHVDHLPSGFTVKQHLFSNRLDYEDESLIENDPLAIKLQQPLPKLRVARAAYIPVLQLFAEEYPEQINLITASHTQMITDEDYNSSHLDLFRYYLPQMLSLDAKQLKRLFKLCQTGAQCDGKRLDYLMTHYQKIAAVFANGFDDNEMTAMNALVRAGFKINDLPQLVNFCQDLTEITLPAQHHPLEVALQTKSDLHTQLSQWKTKLKLKDKQLTALWHLWMDFGDAGLERLLQQWKNQEKENPDVFYHLHASIYATMDNYAPLLFSPEHQQAFQTLTALSKEQRQWWQALLEQHVKAVGFDHLPNLVAAFSEFTRKIADHKLSFYQPVSFEKVNSLPTALANMLTIIENCPPADKKTQWQCITALSLQSNGAIRAISDGIFNTGLKGAKPCYFVSPEMQCEGLHYHADGYKDDPSTIRNHKPDLMLMMAGPKQNLDPDQHEKDFYRFLAHQPLRCSWTFYQDCVAELESKTNLSDENKRSLSILLAKATTGATNNRASKDEDNVRENWHELLEFYDKLTKLPTILKPFKGMIRDGLLKDFLKFETIPDMQCLLSLTKFHERIMTSLSVTAFARKSSRDELLKQMDEVSKIMKRLSQAYPGYPQAVLEGTKFYTELTVANMKEFLTMTKKFPQNFDKQNKSNLLISLFSTFHINPSNVTRIHWLSQDNTHQKNVFYALKLLRSISDNTNLDVDKLEAFLAKLPQNTSDKVNVKKINKLVQRHFPTNFPVGFFETLGGDEVEEATKKLIHKAINSPEIEESFFAFLQQFSKNDHTTLTNKIVAIAELSPPIKYDLIQIIIGKSPFNFNHLDDYDQLFDAIHDSQSPQHFLFFATRLQQDGTLDAKDALLKMSLFLKLSAFTRGSDFSPSIMTAVNDLMADVVMIQPASVTGTEAFKQLFTDILGLLEEKPQDQRVLLALIKPFIVNHNEMTANLENITLLNKELTSIEDPLVMRSLCYHYAQDNQDELISLFQEGRYQSLEHVDKQFILNVVTIHLNNKINYEFNDLSTFLELYSKKENRPVLESLYASSPYPSLKKVNQWLTEHHDPSEIQNAYIDFDKTLPHDPNNGFDYQKASDQAKLLKGTLVSDAELKIIETQVAKANTLTTQELLAAIQNLGPNDTATLVAYMAALLHRSCSTPEEAFEINSTQYLAVYALLTSGRKVTGQIETGEGKSRIMMLLAGCLWVRGMTVDFVTSNMQLASRDYLEYQAFFTTLGATTSLIYANSDYSEYQLGGINFSTAANLRLFRNKASSEGKEALVIAEKSKRSLLIDESDQTFFDASTMRYNYSTDAEKNIKNMTWIYPLLMAFFALDDPEYADREELYDHDIDRCNEAFIAFATLRCNDIQLQQLKAISSKQLETWHNSAMLANKLSFQVDFTIAPDQVISTETGPLVASAAYVITNNREDKQSKYSQGVHQCLVARLNRLKAKPDKSKLSKALQQCETPFHIDAEKRIVYSSTNKTLLDEYSEGQIIATAGTAGLMKEREEAQLLYTAPPLKEGKERQPMRFIDVPRHLPLKRKDRVLRLTATREKQIDAIVEAIREAQANNQPTLLVCENDKESTALSAILKARLGSENITLIDAKTSTKDEAAHVKTTAGLPQAVTISTDMLGRGTDIVLHGEAETKGLRVLATYLPKKRSLQQIIGRSGRFGAKGDSRLILDKQRLLAQLGCKKVSSQFFTATESYVNQFLAQADRQTQLERLLRFAVDDFRTELTQLFFHALGAIEESAQEPYRAAWQAFFSELDKQWAIAWKDLQAELAIQPLDQDKINRKLEDFGATVREEWQTLCTNLNLENNLDEDTKPKLGKVFRYLSQEVEPTPMKPRLFKKYDPAHDGFAACYPRLFTQTRATLAGERKLLANTRAWWNDSGILFANLRAFLQGHTSLRQYLFGASTTHDNVVNDDNVPVYSAN